MNTSLCKINTNRRCFRYVFFENSVFVCSFHSDVCYVMPLCYCNPVTLHVKLKHLLLTLARLTLSGHHADRIISSAITAFTLGTVTFVRAITQGAYGAKMTSYQH